MSKTSQSRSDFITKTRQASSDFLKLAAEFAALRAQWDRGMNAALLESDFIGTHEGLEPADIIAIMTTEGNLVTWLASGNGSNLEKVRL